MKRYLYILTLGVLFALTSCVQEEITVGNGVYYPSSNSGIHVIGASEDFDVKQVGTRAEDDEVADSYISEMTMLIFKEDGTMLPAVNANGEDLESSHINIRRSNPTFLIETSKYDGTGILASMEAGMTAKYYDNTAADIGACSIYIVANAYHLIGERLEAGDIKTLSDLEDALLDTNVKLDMPYDEETEEYIGLPMIGCARDEKTKEPATFNLQYHNAESNNNAVATIPLKKLYSKICFSIQVNSKQLVTGQTPEFELKDVEVFNVPSKVRMGYLSGDYLSNLPATVTDPYLYNYVDDTQKTSFSFKDNDMMPNDVVCRHSSSEDTDDVVKFHFYIPEHKVTPVKTEDNYEYPPTLPKDDRHRQYFKPKLLGDGNIAPFVRIHGSYTDHSGNIHTVAYDIYLGQDEVDDFTILRNQQLNNQLIITGITNRKDAYGGDNNTISIDHRVSVLSTGYNLSIERESLLDSHFEVRPLDIELQPGSTMVVEIPDEHDREWIAMEDDRVATGDKYVSDAHLKGVRKYFTKGLVKELNDAIADSDYRITIHNGEEDKKMIYRIWFYIDENPNVYDRLLDEGVITESKSPNGNGTYRVNDNVYETDKRSRVAEVNFYFSKDGEPDMKEPTTTINFQQWNLWRVWSEDVERWYDIEHEEEYLHNYVSNDPYDPTKQEGKGIPWGLNGVQLSNEHQSFIINETNDDWKEHIKTATLPTYDFYTWQQDSEVMIDAGIDKTGARHDFAGQHFTAEIAKNPNTGIKTDIVDITLDKSANRAVEYCYNRNKRQPNGTIKEEDIVWYLPAADELEDFIVGGYASFKEFQDNYYWTSQPAYTRNIFYYEYRPSQNGTPQNIYTVKVYDDNTNCARATKVISLGNDQFDYVPSGLNDVPDPYVERSGEYEGVPNKNRGYFNLMYRWKRNGEYHWLLNRNPITDDIVYKDEEYNDYTNSVKGYRYHVHLGFLDDLIQVKNGEYGYRLRTESHRVRCVRRSFTTENNQ
jgi:hypothetical protein